MIFAFNQFCRSHYLAWTILYAIPSLALGQNGKPLPMKPSTSIISATPAISEVDINKTLDAIDQTWLGSSSKGKISMTIKTNEYTRKLSMDYWSKEKDKTLIRITSPAKEKGTATLKVGKDVYNYLPKIDRTVKVSSALMTGSWMGSHFTNDDLVKTSRLAEDYFAKVTQSKKTSSGEIWEMDLVPKPSTAVTWSKIHLTLNRSAVLPIRQVFHDEDGKPIRTVIFDQVKKLGGRDVPSVLTVTVNEKPGEFTELVYEDINFNSTVDGSFFSTVQLRKL